MPTLHALQHLYSSVERGYAPQRGRGFQTAAVSAELVDTPDLQALEQASLYATGREGDAPAPVKETFFRLPSGRYAVGRMVDTGTDSLGRSGNYLAHHVVLSREDLIAAGGDPFAILDAAPLATPDTDLSPRALPPLQVCLPDAVPPRIQDDHGLLERGIGRRAGLAGNRPAGMHLPQGREPGPPRGLSAEALSAVAGAGVDRGDRTVLLIGGEERTRPLVRWLLSLLAIEERLGFTFSTHFCESHALRHLFGLATVRTRAEAPPLEEGYVAFDLDEGKLLLLPAASAYGAWLSGCVRAGRWEQVRQLNGALNALRAGLPLPDDAFAAIEPPACEMLWERAGEDLPHALLGRPGAAIAFLQGLSKPRPLAAALLDAGSPSALCGPNADRKVAAVCLSALYGRVPRTRWRRWARKWASDALAPEVRQAGRPWWRRLHVPWRRR